MKQFIAIMLLVSNLFAAEPLPPEKVNTLIEALGRLDPALVKGNASLRERLNQVLDAVRGEPRFVGLVKKFGVKGREADLLEVAAKHPDDPAGVGGVAGLGVQGSESAGAWSIWVVMGRRPWRRLRVTRKRLPVGLVQS